ncbi:MAG: VWA domain-containing protein [Deltaproteobacteria bacterium]|nr:VWA domain-containing protein [Deltaproteobacteria bacterium]
MAAALVFAGSAHAWSRRTADQELSPALVKGKLEGPIATFTVKFVVPVDKGTYGQQHSSIELPPKGMVTSATASLNGVTHSLAMLPAEDAEKKFNALSADEEHPPVGRKASAVLMSGSQGTVGVSVAAANGGVLTLELTVASPTCFFRDRRWINVPEAWAASAEVALRKLVDQDGPNAACMSNGSTDVPRGEGVWMAFPAPELTGRRSGERIGTFAGRVALGDEHVTRFELDLSAKISDVPRDLATVILVDGSRSMFAEELETQRQLVMSYLRAAPDSRVQVIAYARRVKPLLPGWTTASQAAPRLDRELRAMAQRNGSHFDIGLAEAATWLERVEGTKRVVLITDERMAGRLEGTPPATLKRALPAGTLVHVVAVGGSSDQPPSRDEDTKLAPLAAATDGMSVRAGKLEDPRKLHDSTLLVRPVSLDFVKVKAPDWTQITPMADDVACGDEESHEIAEGDSCTWWGQGDASAGPVIVEGLLWGKRIQRFVQPNLAHGRDIARELSVLGTLDEPLLEKAHLLARAVNEKWSLYAQWGGRAGYEDGFGLGMSGGGRGGICCGTVGTIGRGSGTGSYREPPDLAKQLRPLLAACEVETVDVRATLEMTLTEIAELTVTMNHPDGTPSATKRKRQQCVEDALWDSTPMLTHVDQHHTYNVDLRAIR